MRLTTDFRMLVKLDNSSVYGGLSKATFVGDDLAGSDGTMQDDAD